MSQYLFVHPSNQFTNLRNGPSMLCSNSYFLIPNNVNVIKADKENDWSYIFYNSNYGWVKTEYLRKISY